VIGYAQVRMIPALKELWREAFGDGEDYARFFYENRFRPEETILWEQEGEPLAMASLLPASLCLQEREIPARYVYGVATKREARGRGLASRLLEYAAQEAGAKGEALFLVPSEESLFSFYARRGYRPFFSLLEAEIPCGEETALIESAPIAPGEYARLRDRHFREMTFVSWDERAVAYAAKENAFLGGRTVSFSFGGERHAAMVLPQDGTLRVRETTLSEEALRPALGALARGLGCGTIRARLPDPEGTGRPFGMLYRDPRITEAGGYLNLALD